MALLCKHNACKQPLVQGGDLAGAYNRVVKGQYAYTASVQKLLQDYGNESITAIQVQRTPIVGSSVVERLGILKNKPYDELFHLYMILTLSDGTTQINVEKTSVIAMSKNEPTRAGAETKNVKNVPNVTLNELMENGRKKMGDTKWWTYSAIKNNCQSFLLGICTGSNFGGKGTKVFIKQDVTQLLGKTAQKGLNNITSLVGAFSTLKD